MNGNFEWQKQMANERVQAALREADEHLRSQDWRRKSLVRTMLTQLFLGGAGLILIVLLISGCTPVSPAILGEGDAVETHPEGEFPLPYSLDDLMEFYAPQREAAKAEIDSPVQSQPLHPWSVTDRILFHDRLLEVEGPLADSQIPWPMADRIRFHDCLLEEVMQPAQTPWSMADRIRFQDRLEDRY